MTEQEAIKELKTRILQERAIKTQVERVSEEEWAKIVIELADTHLEALTLAIAALEKQIPEQVNGNVDYYTCKCGAILVPMDNYCHDCGQRLKWGKE